MNETRFDQPSNALLWIAGGLIALGALSARVVQGTIVTPKVICFTPT